jgi:protein-tyrosine phosphatase
MSGHCWPGMVPMAEDRIRVLMVCLGNICRSPTAEAVFRSQAEAQGLAAHFEIDSAGTGSWHIGKSPDSRTISAARKRDYDMSALRARQVTPDDMAAFDYVFAMDRQNLHDLLDMSDPAHHGKISLFLHHGNSGHEEVPDPYYSGADGFELVLDLIEDASSNLLRTLAAKHQLP